MSPTITSKTNHGWRFHIFLATVVIVQFGIGYVYCTPCQGTHMYRGKQIKFEFQCPQNDDPPDATQCCGNETQRFCCNAKGDIAGLMTAKRARRSCHGSRSYKGMRVNYAMQCPMTPDHITETECCGGEDFRYCCQKDPPASSVKGGKACRGVKINPSFFSYYVINCPSADDHSEATECCGSLENRYCCRKAWLKNTNNNCTGKVFISQDQKESVLQYDFSCPRQKEDIDEVQCCGLESYRYCCRETVTPENKMSIILSKRIVCGGDDAGKLRQFACPRPGENPLFTRCCGFQNQKYCCTVESERRELLNRTMAVITGAKVPGIEELLTPDGDIPEELLERLAALDNGQEHPPTNELIDADPKPPTTTMTTSSKTSPSKKITTTGKAVQDVRSPGSTTEPQPTTFGHTAAATTPSTPGIATVAPIVSLPVTPGFSAPPEKILLSALVERILASLNLTDETIPKLLINPPKTQKPTEKPVPVTLLSSTTKASIPTSKATDSDVVKQLSTQVTESVSTTVSTEEFKTLQNKLKRSASTTTEADGEESESTSETTTAKLSSTSKKATSVAVAVTTESDEDESSTTDRASEGTEVTTTLSSVKPKLALPDSDDDVSVASTVAEKGKTTKKMTTASSSTTESDGDESETTESELSTAKTTTESDDDGEDSVTDGATTTSASKKSEAGATKPKGLKGSTTKAADKKTPSTEDDSDSDDAHVTPDSGLLKFETGNVEPKIGEADSVISKTDFSEGKVSPALRGAEAPGLSESDSQISEPKPVTIHELSSSTSTSSTDEAKTTSEGGTTTPESAPSTKASEVEEKVGTGESADLDIPGIEQTIIEGAPKSEESESVESDSVIDSKIEQAADQEAKALEFEISGIEAESNESEENLFTGNTTTENSSTKSSNNTAKDELTSPSSFKSSAEEQSTPTPEIVTVSLPQVEPRSGDLDSGEVVGDVLTTVAEQSSSSPKPESSGLLQFAEVELRSGEESDADVEMPDDEIEDFENITESATDNSTTTFGTEMTEEDDDLEPTASPISLLNTTKSADSENNTTLQGVEAKSVDIEDIPEGNLQFIEEDSAGEDDMESAGVQSDGAKQQTQVTEAALAPGDEWITEEDALFANDIADEKPARMALPPPMGLLDEMTDLERSQQALVEVSVSDSVFNGSMVIEEKSGFGNEVMGVKSQSALNVGPDPYFHTISPDKKKQKSPVAAHKEKGRVGTYHERQEFNLGGRPLDTKSKSAKPVVKQVIEDKSGLPDEQTSGARRNRFSSQGLFIHFTIFASAVVAAKFVRA